LQQRFCDSDLPIVISSCGQCFNFATSGEVVATGGAFAENNKEEGVLSAGRTFCQPAKHSAMSQSTLPQNLHA
jgi:hypothetical protein